MASIKKTKRNKPGKQPKTTVRSGIETKKTEYKITEQKKRTSISKPILPGRWQTNAGIFLLLIIGTLALYSGDLHLGFFSVDDPGYVVNDPWIKGVTAENLQHILSSPYFANYSPVHLFSYMLDYAIAGPNAYAFHLSSNLWAGVVAGFVFLVALALTRRQSIAIAAAILFVVHPSHVEAVAWISSRKDLIAAAFALPSLLAYLRYRKQGEGAKRWYIISLLLFLFSVAGKLSVATFPAVLLALDLFVEKRSLIRSLPDKIPFLIAAIIIALAAASAQPSMGNRPDPFVLLAALGQNFWLLSGFGSYVVYRVPPHPAGVIFQLVSALLLLLIFISPFLIRRRLPLIAVLFYWILFAFIPTQVLSFTHPVTDRYLFFPSVAAVILVAWGVVKAGERLGQWGLRVSFFFLLILSVFWGRVTLNYLAEWNDPRSIWYAASAKSSDPVITQNLGTFYLDKADHFGSSQKEKSIPMDEAKRFASAIWANDARLPKLFSEWDSGQHGGPTEKIFQEEIKKLSLQAFQRSLDTKGNRIMAGLYYNKGLLLLNSGDLQGARKEFLAAIDEASRETFAEVREQLTVYCHTDLGIIAWRSADYKEALKWFKQAEQEQTRFGGNWIPNISANRKRMEEIIASQANH